MNQYPCLVLVVFSMLSSILVGEEKIQLGKRKWLLEPGVNCKLEDYRSVFGSSNVMTLSGGFDGTTTDKEGSTTVSANANGQLESKGKTYQFAPTRGIAGVYNNYTPDISAAMDVGFEAEYKVLMDVVDAASATPTQGGAYARNLLMLRVTDNDDHKVYTKYATNHCKFAGAFVLGETADRADSPLTFTLKPGHHYKLEAYIETKAAGYAEPNSTNTGSGENNMKVKINALRIVPKNPPWVSVWVSKYVPSTYDTYDRYERVLQGEHKAYFPSEFRFEVSAGGDYTQADSYVTLNCGQAQVRNVQGNLPGASINTGRVRYMLPQGGGEWYSSVWVDAEIDPNKAPVTTLPVPLAQYWLTMEKSNQQTQTLKFEYEPKNWGIKIGDEVIPYNQWGTGAVLQALVEQNRTRKETSVASWNNLYFMNPKTGVAVPVSELMPSGLKPVKVSIGNPTIEISPASLQQTLADRVVIYSEKQVISVQGHAANGGVQFACNHKEEVGYTAVFDFIPRPQPIELNAR